jgi:hypothetical protein
MPLSGPQGKHITSNIDTMASTSKKRVVPHNGMQIIRECSDSNLRSIRNETDSNDLVDDVAVIDTVMNLRVLFLNGSLLH